MRPSTLAEVSNRVISGEKLEKAMAEFLDEFYNSSSVDIAEGMLQDSPPLTGDGYIDALMGAVGDYLSLQYLKRSSPRWTQDAERFSKEPVFTSPVDTPEIKAWLMHSSPGEFKHHNIFTEAIPLRRKRSERPRWLEDPGVVSMKP